MSKEDIEEEVRPKKRTKRCIEDLISTAHALWEKGIGPNHEGIKRKEVEETLDLDLEYKPKTVLAHLTEVGIVEEFVPPGPSTFVIAEWKNDGDGEIVLGEVQEAAEEGLRALANHVETDPVDVSPTATADGSGTVRGVLAWEFGLVPDKIEDYLRETDDPVDVLNRSVKAIKEAEGIETEDDYGEIVFVNMPHRFRLTEKAVSLYER